VEIPGCLSNHFALQKHGLVIQKDGPGKVLVFTVVAYRANPVQHVYRIPLFRIGRIHPDCRGNDRIEGIVIKPSGDNDVPILCPAGGKNRQTYCAEEQELFHNRRPHIRHNFPHKDKVFSGTSTGDLGWM